MNPNDLISVAKALLSFGKSEDEKCERVEEVTKLVESLQLIHQRLDLCDSSHRFNLSLILAIFSFQVLVWLFLSCHIVKTNSCGRRKCFIAAGIDEREFVQNRTEVLEEVEDSDIQASAARRSLG